MRRRRRSRLIKDKGFEGVYRDSSYLLVTWLTEFLAFTMVSLSLYDADEAYL